MRGSRHSTGLSGSLLFSLLLVSLDGTQGRAQVRDSVSQLPVAFTYTLPLADSVVRLPAEFREIAPWEGLTVRIDSLSLSAGKDFWVDTLHNVLRISPELLTRVSSAAPNLGAPGRAKPRVIVETTRRAGVFKSRFSLPPPRRIASGDTALASGITPPLTPPLQLRDVFGPGIQRSGSLTRGFVVGSNRDVSLTSNFRLQLSGMLGADIAVAAALADENSPIPPEGLTKQLQEFDKVFVEIRAPRAGATLGDFDFMRSGGSLGVVQRKLQGAEGRLSLGDSTSRTEVTVAAAVARGKFTTNRFNGLDAVQGPYQLAGANGERSIVVVPGSERVSIDGEPMTRGAVEEYTIDYSLAQVTFTVRRIISSASRISVDFQYVDRQYTRTFAGADVRSTVAGGALGVSYYREADNQDSPIDVVLSDSDRAIISKAGSDPFAAAKSSIMYTGVDSVTGASKGRYLLVDTVVAGSPLKILRYAPGDVRALYDASFTFVGDGKGEYSRRQIGEFSYAGPGGGSYAPITLLPIPQLHQLADVSLARDVGNAFHAEVNYALSSFDANRFSAGGTARSTGHAVNARLSLRPVILRVGGVSLGEFGAAVSDNYYGDSFRPLDRIKPIEFNRIWDVSDTLVGSQNVLTAELLYHPSASLTLLNTYGLLTTASGVSSSKYSGRLRVESAPSRALDYTVEYVQREGGGPLSSNWLRQHGSGFLDLGAVKPAVRFEAEDRRQSATDSTGAASLDATSFRFAEVAPSIGFPRLLGSSFSLNGFFRFDDLPYGGEFVRQATSTGFGGAWKYTEGGGLSASIDLTQRTKRFDDQFKTQGSRDAKTLLVRSVTQYRDGRGSVSTDLYYEFGTERAAKLERVFLRVEKGTGSYTYIGDSSQRAVPDPNKFVPVRFDGDYVPVTVPSDRLYPVSSVKSGIRVRLTPARLWPQASSFVESALAALSSETSLRVEEKSTDERMSDLYLLRLSRFLNDSTTLLGMNLLSQDVYLFENSQLFSVRGRLIVRNGLSQFASYRERSASEERSVRVRVQPLREFSIQAEYGSRVNRLRPSTTSDRAYDVSGSSGVFDFSYRPEQEIEFGLHVEVGENENTASVPLQSAGMNAEGVRFVRSFAGKGQFRVEFHREEVLLSSSSAPPYEMTNGRLPGVNFLWSAWGDFRFAGFLQASARYDGRTGSSGRVIHSLQAEVRAFF